MRTLAIALLVLLTGCSTTVTRTVDSVAIKYQTIPDELLSKCNATPPPNIEEYMHLDLAGRENSLINYSQALLVDLKHCDNKITAIRNWQTEIGKLDEHQNQGN
jgi:hypothetical protein